MLPSWLRKLWLRHSYAWHRVDEYLYSLQGRLVEAADARLLAERARSELLRLRFLDSIS